MKNTSKSLNDLFRRAGDEAGSNADGTVLSQSEIERLLRNSNVHSVPVTTGARIYRAFFSTPLKKGMTAMTTTALITLGIFAFWPQNTVQHSRPAADSPIYRTNKPASPNPASGNFIPSAPKTMLGAQRTLYSTPALSAVPTESIAIADSLHPVDATPEQLAKLGIILEDNGDIVIYKKDGDKIDKFGLPTTWGLQLNIGQDISEEDTAGLNITKSFPRLITEPDGAKRLFTFEQDTSFTQKNGDRVMVMHMENQTQVVPPNSNLRTASNLADSSSHVMRRGINSRLRVIATDSNSRLDVENGMVNVNVDSIMAAINMDSILAMVNLDSILKIVKDKKNPDMNIDSAMREARIALKNAKHILSSMHFMVDTGNSANVKIEMDANSDNPADSALFSSEMNELEADSLVVNGNSITTKGISRIQNIALDENASNDGSSIQVHTIPSKSNNKTNVSLNNLNNVDRSFPPPPPLPPYFDMTQLENSLDLSKLIPIRVVNNKNPEHPNVLIFWYDPTPDVQVAIPNHTEVSAEMATKHVTVSVYPNPTPGPAAVHFDLAGANSASYTIRNLLGQEVMSGGTLSGSTGDVKLDLSKLDAGVYLLVTETNSGEPDVQRIVVAK